MFFVTADNFTSEILQGRASGWDRVKTQGGLFSRAEFDLCGIIDTVMEGELDRKLKTMLRN